MAARHGQCYSARVETQTFAAGTAAVPGDRPEVCEVRASLWSVTWDTLDWPVRARTERVTLQFAPCQI
jgi:hypothetical protein